MRCCFHPSSSHLTKCHVCHGICTLSPLPATLPMRFAKNPQHDTSEVLCLPRKIAMEFSKVLRLARKMHLIFWKRRKGIAPTTENNFRRIFETCWYVTKCHACHVKQGYVTRRLQLPQVTTFGELAIGTAIATSLPMVADGCGRRSDVERTRPHPQPQSKTRTLRYAFGNIEKLTKNLSPDGPSPHARTGFFFLILYRAPPPSPFFSHTTLSHTHTHTHTILSYTILSHAIFHTQLCHTHFFTHNFVHTIFHTQFSHTQSFTHNFDTHTQSFTQLCHTQSFICNIVIHLHFAWPAWHLATSTFTLRGRRGAEGTGLALVACLGVAAQR